MRRLKGDEIFEKCVPIYGEVGRDCLGLWPKDREILQDEVEYVINTAASIKFDDPLKTALLINAKGTLTMIELAKGMKKLKVNRYRFKFSFLISTHFSDFAAIRSCLHSLQPSRSEDCRRESISHQI